MNDNLKYFVHEKTGNLYTMILDDATDCTNSRDGLKVVIYQKDNKTFVRDVNEFYKRFEEISFKNYKKVPDIDSYATWLPWFPGFYNTCLEYHNIECDVSDIYNIRKEKNFNLDINSDDLDYDNKDYETRVVKEICELIPDLLKNRDMPVINKIQLEKIVSPREYNFINDSANVIVEVKPYLIRSYIHNNKKKYEQYLKDNFTSCDGFMSFHDNYFSSWQTQTNDFTNYENNHFHLGSLLDFIIKNMWEDIDEIILNMLEETSYCNIKNYDKLISCDNFKED